MIEITKEAAEWFIRELGLEAGQAVRFFARYSAGGHIHPGFSLGIEVEQPLSPGASAVAEGITFYMEDRDLWYLDGYRLAISYDDKESDILYSYEEVAAK
ncbi:Iron-sulfur cluster biosynthesis [compost metagenome]